MTLGPLDRAASTTREAALQLRDSRRRREGAASEVPTSPDPAPGPSGIHGLAASSIASEDSSDGMEGTTGSLTARKRTEKSDFTASDENLDRNQDDLTFTALAADRYGVSNRAVAGVINAFQMDIGRLTSDDKSKIVDPKKSLARQAGCSAGIGQTTLEAAAETGVQSLYFDGRKDKTCTTHTSPTETEEHVVVLSEPSSIYISHFTPQSGRAIDMFHELYSLSMMFGDQVKVIGCDGTAVNMGVNGGVCRLFELSRNQPIHWFICQLHGNELNLRHLLQHFDGTTTGPRSFSGPIGSKCAANVWNLKVVRFEGVPGHVEEPPAHVLQGMSNDQQLLLELCLAVQNGSVNDSTARRRIGPMNHAR